MKVFINPYSTPGNIAHAVDDAWTAIDLTSDLGADAGSVAGVCLELINVGSTGALAVGVRHGDSTDTFTGDVAQGARTQLCAGLNSGDEVDVYLEDASEFEVYLIGYWMDSEAEFKTNAVEKTLSSAAVWEAVDVSGDFTGTVLAACVQLQNAVAGSYSAGLQQASGADRYSTWAPNELIGGVLPCTSEQFEAYVGSTSNMNLYVTGAITANITAFSEDTQTFSSSNYEENDLSASIPDGGTSVLYQCHIGSGFSTDISCGHRAEGQDAQDEYHGTPAGTFFIGPINTTSRKIDAKVSNTSWEVYSIAYQTVAAAAGGGGDVPSLTTLHNRRRGILL